MANFQQVSDSSSHMTENGVLHGVEDGGRWYFSRKEIEEDSPSRLDGIDLKKETYLRKWYCTFLQDLGMRLKVPQLTIATAIIFCHRFFHRQSHAKNDRRVIATVCMFLAGKVEETPRPLKDVILISYEIINKKDPEAVQRIKQKEVYEQQKELILIGERVVLATLAFDLNVHHPYKPLVEAIKKFKVAQNALAQVAWNFVNDGLRTSLCLQFKPHHIAAGAIFLAAKFLKVKLPSDGDKVWWQEFDVTPRQLEDVSNQMLELYEQNRSAAANSEAEGTNVGVTNWPTSKASSGYEDRMPANSHSHVSASASKPGGSKPRPAHEQTFTEVAPRTSQNQDNEDASVEMGVASDKKVDDQAQDNRRKETEKLPSMENVGEAHGDQERNSAKTEKREAGESKDKQVSLNPEHKEGTSVGHPPRDSVIKIDRDKLKAKREKQKKSRGDIARKTDTLDEDDLIERELESGIELAAENEKNKQVRRPSAKLVYEKYQDDSNNGQLSQGPKFNNMEEGEVPDEIEWLQKSPNDGVNRDDTAWMRKSPKYGDHYHMDDHSGMSQLGYMERDHKRHVPENHV